MTNHLTSAIHKHAITKTRLAGLLDKAGVARCEICCCATAPVQRRHTAAVLHMKEPPAALLLRHDVDRLGRASSASNESMLCAMLIVMFSMRRRCVAAQKRMQLHSSSTLHDPTADRTATCWRGVARWPARSWSQQPPDRGGVAAFVYVQTFISTPYSRPTPGDHIISTPYSKICFIRTPLIRT